MRSLFQRIFRSFTKANESTWRFALLAAFVFAGVLVYGHAHHEPWRDELHPWVMMRDSAGFLDVTFGDRIYEGHPPLWFWYLRAWTRLTRHVWGLHAATIAAEAAAVLLFFRWAPFPRVLKILLAFSYLLGFEYGIMSRNYTLGVLCAFAFVASFRTFRPRALTFALLGLLSLSSIYGLCLACALFVVLFLRWSRLHPVEGDETIVALRMPRILAAGTLFFAVMVVFTYVSTNPPDANPYSPDWNFGALNSSAIPAALDRFVAAMLPLRQPTERHFWAAAVPYAAQLPRLFTVLRYLVPSLCLLSLLPAWPEALALLLGTAFMAIIQTARYLGHIRHWGSFFVLYLVLAWLARASRPRAKHWLSTALLLAIGLCQTEGFLVALDKDRQFAFAGGGEVAAKIKARGLDRYPLVLGPDWASPSITAYLDKTFVGVETEELSQTLVFHGRRNGFSAQALADRAAQIAVAKHTPVLVVSTHAVPAPHAPVKSFDLVIQNEIHPLQSDEQFNVYLLTPLP